MIAASTSLRSCAWMVFFLLSLFACSSAPSSSKYSRLDTSVASDGFTNFETESARPLALSPDGRYLFALDTAEKRLEIRDAQDEPLLSAGETAVGLRPVAIAWRGLESWVVDHLLDSVSVVDVRNPSRPRVARALPVGDLPRRIVVSEVCP